MHDNNREYFGDVQSDTQDELIHYGVKRRSGRYPWGSGKEPYQHSGDFLSRVEGLMAKGFSEKEIGETLGMTTTDLRLQIRVAKHERKNLDADRARSLKADGLSNYEIARQMGYKNESSIRSLLNEDASQRRNAAQTTADLLKREVDKKGMIDIGGEVERELGVSKGCLSEASFILETQGYHVYGVGVPQVNNKGKQINMTVLTKPDIDYKHVYDNMGDIKSVKDYHSTDGGKTFDKVQYPASIDSKRVMVRYREEGGVERDGTMEIRRGCKDLSLGESNYAQVRILVDGTHYLKGMAVYSDNLPPGVDIVFNTNKKKGTPKMDVFKEIKKDDPNNPFGAYISAAGQSQYLGKDGKMHLSPINKLKQEGDWDSMSKNLSSQFLAKQPMPLIKRQLDLTYGDKHAEFERIMALTNPTVKRKMLQDFADGCDGAVVHLKAAALPRQKVQVILPVPELKDHEIYAPNYKNGEKVALVRYPHGGTFEIPVLTVNNRNPHGRAKLGQALDAVGINSRVAERLSGADFDGDQVMVIPTNAKVKIKSTQPLKGLEGFDTRDAYGPETYAHKKNVAIMSKSYTQKQMGMVSNLITDMTLRGATDDELARAVRHSMVVIDAHKHKLDYKQSEKDNGIKELKEKYQGRLNPETGRIQTGASTLLSRRKQEIQVDERRGSAQIDPETGKVSYKTSGRTYTDKNGNVVKAQTKVHLLTETDDLHKLSSGTPQEAAYADYGNRMKALANQARKEMKATPRLQLNPEAKEKYRKEVDELNAALNIALKNAPRERRAQAIANAKIKAIEQENPDIDKKELRKIGQQAIYDARIQVGASGRETKIKITPAQWEAIQKGAVSDSKLSSILRYADDDIVRDYATPRQQVTLTVNKVSRLNAMIDMGYTNAEIAKMLNISTSTITKYKK